MILRGDSEKFEYLSKDETKNENILTHWSVAQASSNDEKNLESIISLNFPFKGQSINTSIHPSIHQLLIPLE